MKPLLKNKRRVLTLLQAQEARDRANQYRKRNPEKVKVAKAEWQRKNMTPERRREERIKNHAKRIAADRKYRRKTAARRSDQSRSRYITDIAHRLKVNYRNRISAVLRTKARLPSGSLLGCTAEELKSHLERQFLPRMTWENYGKAWHVDHVFPCDGFDFSNQIEIARCFHYTNLQPLWAVVNLRKNKSRPLNHQFSLL